MHRGALAKAEHLVQDSLFGPTDRRLGIDEDLRKVLGVHKIEQLGRARQGETALAARLEQGLGFADKQVAAQAFETKVSSA